MLLQSIDGKRKRKGSCRQQEIIHRSFLREMEYWGARGQVKILGKSDGECPSEVRRARLSCRGTHFEYSWQWEYYFFIRLERQESGDGGQYFLLAGTEGTYVD